MRIDELPQSARIEDRRGIPGGRGGIGIGTVVVLALIGWALGIDPRTLIGGAEMVLGGGEQQQTSSPSRSSGEPSDAMGHFVSAILGSTETVWTDIFAQSGRTYTAPTLVMFLAAGLQGPRWDRSIVHSIKRSTSTRASFRTSKGAWVLARSAVRRVSSRKLT
jgi:uncharacterized protein